MVGVIEAPMSDKASSAGHGGPRPGAGRPKSGSDHVAVKLDRAIVAKAKVVAAHRGVTLAELLSGSLKAPIDQAYAQMIRELNAK